MRCARGTAPSWRGSTGSSRSRSATPLRCPRARAALRRTGAPEVELLDSSLAAFAHDLRGDRPRALALLLSLEQDRYRVDNIHPYLAGVHRMTASRWLAVSGDTLGAARLLTWHEAIGYPLAARATMPTRCSPRSRIWSAPAC